MGHSLWRGRSLAVALLVAGLFAATTLFSADAAVGKGKTVAVFGAWECADCASKNVKDADVFQELSVVINCKAGKGADYQSRGVGKLDKDGKFTVKLPSELLIREDGKLKVHCFAVLHGAVSKNARCPTASGRSIEPAKLVLIKSRDVGQQYTFTTATKLSFSLETCPAAWFWHDPRLPISKHPDQYSYPWPETMPGPAIKDPPDEPYPPTYGRYPGPPPG